MNISEIFLSIQGETSSAGLVTVFIRTAGCNLSCSYCDTEYAKNDGEDIPIDRIIEQASSFNIRRVTITGGEPFYQKDFPQLCRQLIKNGFGVQVETNGSFDISDVPDEIRIILDVKTPGSGMMKHNVCSNIKRLRVEDEIKFVLTSREDYNWAVQFIQENSIQDREVLFAPAGDRLNGKDLAEWILNDRFEQVRLQLQLHRILWPGERGK